MSEQVVKDLATLGLSFLGYVVLAAVIVMVLRRRGPVWGSRAANASLLASALAFVRPAYLVPAGGEERPFVEVVPAFVMTLCAVVVVTTALGSRLSRLPATGDVRQARIAPRRLFVARVPHQRLAALVSAAIAFAAMAAASLMPAAGSYLVRRHDDAGGVSAGFPGWPALLPTACAGVVLAASAWWALREITDRPRIGEPTDTHLRARDASRVVRAAAFGFAVTGSAVLFSIGAHMNEATQRLRAESVSAPRSPWDPYQWLAFGLYIPATCLVFVALAALAGSVGSREELERAAAPVAGRRGTPHAGDGLDTGLPS